MTDSAQKFATPAVKTDLEARVKSAKLAKPASSSLSQRSACASPAIKSHAPPPRRKAGNRFTQDAASILSFAIQAGIVTPSKKLTSSFK